MAAVKREVIAVHARDSHQKPLNSIGERWQFFANTASFLRRCVYQWAVALEEGEESGEELPDPPACNAPVPKKASGGEDDEEEEGDGGDEDEEGEQVAAAAWSGDDEDLVGNAPKEVCAKGSRLEWDCSPNLRPQPWQGLSMK